MELKGKKILFLGDSITEGHGTSSPEDRFSNLIEKQEGAVCYNYGIGWNAVLISCCASAGLGTLTCLLKIKSWTKFCG